MDSIPSHRVPVQEALFIALMDDPNGKSGGTAMMSKVFEMRKKFNMGFHSFHDYEHSGMPAMPDGTPMFWFINTGWFMICGKTRRMRLVATSTSSACGLRNASSTSNPRKSLSRNLKRWGKS